MGNVKFWFLGAMSKWQGVLLRRIPQTLALWVLSAGLACANSVDTLDVFLKTTRSGRADFTQVV